VLAFDVLLDRPGGRDALIRRARGGQPPDLVPLAELASRADIVLSTVTTDVAVDAAKTAAPLLHRDQVFVDLNATSPAIKREIAPIIDASAANFVEGAILSAVGVMGAKSKVLLCGARADEVAATMSGLGLNFHAYGSEIGKASSFKMLRSVFSKGLEALLIECLLAAHRAGIEHDMWREIVATMDAASFDEIGGNWIRTHATAHGRRYHEMLQVRDVLRELSLDAPMTDATIKLFERSSNAALKDAFTTTPATSAEVIAALDSRIATSANDKR
jgi:3-hydroxyisobutyrate dehydrogenase-like beta-hydroxyacid dehydrogenase